MFVRDQISSGYVGLNFTYTLPIGTSSGNQTLNTYDRPMLVTQVCPEIYYQGTLQLLNADAGLDKVTFQIQNPQKQNAAPFNTAATMSQWYQLGLGQNFKGFILPPNTTLTYIFTHTSQNWATANTSLDLSVAFTGILGTMDELASYFNVEEN